MELWQDFQSNNFFLLDKDSGTQSFCNKYGSIPESFKPYSTGFLQFRSKYSSDPDSNYRVQPKKFDGYFQCPRPVSQNRGKQRPYTRDTKIYRIKRLPEDFSKLPKPVSSLGFSRVYDKSNHAPLIKQARPPIINIKEGTSIELIKKNSEQVPIRDIKTASDIFQRHELERKSINGYQPNPEKIVRRKLKGFFLVDFPHSTDLFLKEKKILEITNPVSFAKQRHYESTDLKNLEKRREQRVLKNKLIQS